MNALIVFFLYDDRSRRGRSRGASLIRVFNLSLASVSDGLQHRLYYRGDDEGGLFALVRIDLATGVQHGVRATVRLDDRLQNYLLDIAVEALTQDGIHL